MAGLEVYLSLNSLLVKPEYAQRDLSSLLKPGSMFNEYDLSEEHELDAEGKLFVKTPVANEPKWRSFAESVVGEELTGLQNISNSAVLLIKSNGKVVAFTFGYGRFLLDLTCFVPDFGIKTALNTLDHSSLRSVDVLTLDDQAVQKKSQSSKEAGVDIFGIDVSRDILRAVTGSAKDGVELNRITGGDAIYSFSLSISVSELPSLIDTLYGYYNNESYKNEFSWVDNIRRVKNDGEISSLNESMLDNVKLKNSVIKITMPEIINWDLVHGFSYTRAKTQVNPTIETEDYFDTINATSITIESIKSDKLFVFYLDGSVKEYSIYKCLYYEFVSGDKTYVMFSGVWYEINNKFILDIDANLSRIPISSLSFPDVHVWTDRINEKDILKIESEGHYNSRVSTGSNFYLLDKNLVKTSKSTSSIELCDLMTIDRKFVHVKHRKGGSSGLSHLFAQGYVSAELTLSDRDFRKEARKKLKPISSSLRDTIPIDGYKSSGVEIVFLVLGEDSASLISNLPLFSKVNLSKVYDNLIHRGFDVSVAGAAKLDISQ
ncbi:TIGR04141 family sporadically distributed protein [Cobetia marina]|uniref:TIGR04141 family sporadically distributed protein n=1 Tax=Cobetia marina TaxID=28258 RepID=UPI000A009577|nr:TIGR04141 family sporadically distributed protein [Cobetia marina]